MTKKTPEQREKARAYARAYYYANREAVLEARREKYANDPELRARMAAQKAARGKSAEDSARHYAKNRERLLEQCREYQAATKEQRRAWRQTPAAREAERVRRAKRRLVEREGTLTTEQWLAILDEFDHRCAYCNQTAEPLEIEHLTPLSRGGGHDAENVVPACRRCNLAKHARTLFEYVGVMRAA